MASWDDPRAVQAANSGPKESLFLNLKDDLRVRVIGAPEFFERHWVRSRIGKDVAIRCPGAIHCPVCAMGDKPRLRAILPVLDRKTNKARLLDVPQIIIGYLKALKDGEWGDLSQYDVLIQRIQVGKKTDYQVTPQPARTPLTEIDQAEIRHFFETVDYQKYAQPHTIEEALALLNGQQLPSKRPENISYAGVPSYTPPTSTPSSGYVPPTISPNLQTFATPTPPTPPIPPTSPITTTTATTPTPPNIPTQPITPASLASPAPQASQTMSNVTPSYTPPSQPNQQVYIPPTPNQSTSSNVITDQLINQFLPQGNPPFPNSGGQR